MKLKKRIRNKEDEMNVLIKRIGIQIAVFRFRFKFNKKIIVFLRKMAFILFSLILRWPILISLFFISRFIKLFDYLFLVYPGSDKDLDGYCPRWLANSFLFKEKPVVGGIISKGQTGQRGLVLVVPNKAFEFKQKEVSLRIKKRLERFRKITRAKKIALAGQAPGFMKKAVGLGDPFVEGVKGTVFCIVETLKEIARKEKINKEAMIVVVGVGRTGQAVMNYLAELKMNVVGVDVIRKKGEKRVVLTSDASEVLCKGDIIIVLTPKGSDFLPYLKNLKKDAIVIDDTHPKMKVKKASQKIYKVAVGVSGVKFYPRLPGYKKDWIPGCTTEAIVEATTRSGEESQQNFNRLARKIGFRPILIKNKRAF